MPGNDKDVGFIDLAGAIALWYMTVPSLSPVNAISNTCEHLEVCNYGKEYLSKL